MSNLHQNSLVLIHPAINQTNQPSLWHNKIQAFWTSFGLERSNLSLDPEILQGGQNWCYVYESTTGQVTYLESERDIDMWLDEKYRNTVDE